MYGVSLDASWPFAVASVDDTAFVLPGSAVTGESEVAAAFAFFFFAVLDSV